MYLLDKLTGLLPVKLQPYAKAIYPAVAAVAAVGAQWIATGELDTNELRTAATVAASALITLAIPNRGS